MTLLEEEEEKQYLADELNFFLFHPPIFKRTSCAAFGQLIGQPS